ncbi:MAG: class I SAM-dependent methyltransferase [Planctomycetaceae bacterium]|nr:class I SAM-dependent methyltransferase [Planctomycetales bacterium]MCB9927729.1 class I SAM-dependent methyltransferase [Planctomycetaceae bacterium]
METLNANLYDYPRYYDLVFGSDWKAEFDFLKACFPKHATGTVHRIFEPACGTGRLMYRLAKAGFDVSGLDLNAKAVAYCNERLKRHGFPESAFVADMTDFRLKRKADVAFNMINSFRHLRSESAAKSHLMCVANGLRKGGLYVLGLHLTPTGCAASEEESWSASRGNLCVNTRLWTTHRDLTKRSETFSMTFDIYTPTKSFRIEDTISFRTYTAKEMSLLVKNAGHFEIVATYDFSYNAKRPIEIDSRTEDVVYILQKQ